VDNLPTQEQIESEMLENDFQVLLSTLEDNTNENSELVFSDSQIWTSIWRNGSIKGRKLA